ncbi:MAG: GILT family protein [archaeon]|nr:GILT family protein [archaeon]
MNTKVLLLIFTLSLCSISSTVIDVYIESLCPDCVEFITGSFKKFYEYNQPNLVTVNFIPFGNANQTYNEQTKKWEFTCQHKENECYGNQLQTCAINLMGREQSYPLLICVYQNILKERDFDKTLAECLGERKDLLDQINECKNSELGNLYEHEMASKTQKHSSVPWVMVDGEYNEEVANRILESLTEYACSLPGNKCTSSYTK